MEQIITKPVYHVAVYTYRPKFGMRVSILNRDCSIWLCYTDNAVRYKSINNTRKYVEKFVASNAKALMQKGYNFLSIMQEDTIVSEYSVKNRKWTDVNMKLTND